MILLIILTLIASQISDWQFDASLQATYKHLPKDPMQRAINEARGRFNFFTTIIGILLQATLSGFIVNVCAGCRAQQRTWAKYSAPRQ